MIPVLTPDEMSSVDRRAPEPVDVLIGRAGAAVARVARNLLGGAYGRRIVVVAGKGNNGADGRAAAAALARRGAAVQVLDAGELAPGATLPASDLVIDAAYGTGLQRRYDPPDVGRAPVLAVDIPSGLSGRTGVPVDGGRPLAAMATVTFAALKPGLLLGDGPELAGPLEVADIGLGPLVEGVASTHLATDGDVAHWFPPRPRQAHKWQAAVQIVAGSPGMTGAAWLSSRAALRSGAGYVRLATPGVEPTAAHLPPGEVVVGSLPARGWADGLLADLTRYRSLVVGPGLGAPSPSTTGPGSDVARLLASAALPAVVDADGLAALGDIDVLASIARRRRWPTIITPHDGEYTRLLGSAPGPDRIDDVRSAAVRSSSIVVLKGSTTVIAAPDGRAIVVTSGSPRLATAGTGDVLSGVIGAFLARGVPGLEAAALAAHVHGRAADLGPAVGLVASDLPELVSRWLSGTVAERHPTSMTDDMPVGPSSDDDHS
jgi:NAD(P)H-hydrate epimerase